jgi:hypothetical protein
VRVLSLAVLASLFLASCQSESPVSSPNGRTVVHVNAASLPPTYTVLRDGDTLVGTSTLDMQFEGTEAPFSLWSGLTYSGQTTQTIDETYELPWGEWREVHHHGNQAVYTFEGERGTVTLTFHVTDEGFAFRYGLALEKDSLPLFAEESTFNLNANPEAFWIPGDWDIYEHLYNRSPLRSINAIAKRNHPNLAQTYIPYNAVNTPVTLVYENGTHLALHEAALVDYPGMTLAVDTLTGNLRSQLVGRGPLAQEDYAAADPGAQIWIPGTFQTPWRMVLIADDAPGLLNSHLVLDLNEPNKLGDVSWFEPMKYMGIWWEMHLGKSTWDMFGSQSMSTFDFEGENGGAALKPTGRHGANTENAKRYIDFASQHGFKGLLVEGWNVGWEHWIGFEDREGVFDFVSTYPDYDLQEVQRYANEHGMSLIMHHETSSAPRTYDQQMDTAYSLMQSLGIHSVKTGYVGKIIPKTEFHHGRWMVRHYQRSVERAAAHQVAVNIHEPIKATGLRRTYPNLIAREGARGQEFNAWSIERGNPPSHIPTMAFTRMLGGPMDFTPGVFQINLDAFKPGSRINTTIAQQLGLYIVMYSPVQMACDLPEHYAANLPALKFIEEVGVDWETSEVLDGEVGEYVVVARQERKAQANGRRHWFVGAANNEVARDYTLTLDFLPEGESFTAHIYRDDTAAGAHCWDNPTALKIESITVKKGDKIACPMAVGGGFAVSLLAE